MMHHETSSTALQAGKLLTRPSSRTTRVLSRAASATIDENRIPVSKQAPLAKSSEIPRRGILSDISNKQPTAKAKSTLGLKPSCTAVAPQVLKPTQSSILHVMPPTATTTIPAVISVHSSRPVPISTITTGILPKHPYEDPMLVDYDDDEDQEEEEDEDDEEALAPIAYEDIDAEDLYEPQSCVEYVHNIMSYLKEKETLDALPTDFLARHGPEITPRMRSILIDWVQEVATKFKLLIETFQLSVYLLDHFLHILRVVRRDRLQLIAVACLFTACKFEEIYPPVARDFIYISDNAFTQEDLFAAERALLSAIRFNLGLATPIHFLRRVSKAGHSDGKLHTLSKYLTELALPEYGMMKYRPSVIASAAVYLARKMSGGVVDHWTPTLEIYSGYRLDQIQPCAVELNDLVRRAHAKSQCFKATMEKYKGSKTSCVSLILPAQF
eukprot:TRINITY_DN2702_c1_g1_i5.p1 TRINITY_DN2702_c1_g1~~TRINITY_DN2702_c1_g1_i5.p1  ORF type:complete len:441 (+),score=116.67 TRINITY_DN2702_c1_g1_i5:161-1483(+)